MDDSEYPKVWLGEDGVLRVDYRGPITLEAAKLANKKHMAITKEPSAVMLVGERVVTVDREAERFASSPEVVSATLAMGIVTKSQFQKHIGKMFLWYLKPPFPTRLFTSEQEALKWLYQFVPTDKK